MTETRKPEKKKAAKPAGKNKTAKTAKTAQKKKTAQATETKLKKELDAAKKEAAALADQLLRRTAEMDNMRKRNERDCARIIQQANRDLIKDVLTVVDDLERSLEASKQTEDKELLNGVELIHQKLMTVFSRYGLAPIESVGKPFDVELHEALLQVENKDAEPGTIVEEYEKGYVLNGEVIRHAKVVVSK